MDTIFYNGIIHTLDKAYPEVSALAIKDGVILRLGSDEEILALKTPQTRLIDLQGRLMLPGFADTHLHLLFYGTFRRRIDLVNTTTYEEVVRMCREGAEKVRGTNRWVIGCNFNQINWTVDTTLLGIISGTAATAIYGVGAQINQYYMALSTSISGVFTPQINRIVARGEGDEQLTRLFTRVGRIQFMLLMLVLTGFIFVGMPFIQAWGGAEYAPAYWVALLLIGPVTVPLIQNIGIEIQRAKNMHQFRSKVYFCMAIGNAIVSVPLGMKFGGIGCALGTAISMIVGNGFIMNWYYQTHIGLDMVYFWKRILGIVPAMLPAVALGVAAVRLHTFTGYSGVLTFAVPYAAVYAAGLYRFAMDESERDMVRSVVRKIRR